MDSERTSVRAGWVVARSRRMAYDPGRVLGVVSLEAEFDRGLGQWVAAAAVAPLAGPLQGTGPDPLPGSLRHHLTARAGFGDMARAVLDDLQAAASAPLDLVEVTYRDALAITSGRGGALPAAWAGARSPVNTRIEYLYRDAGNFKTWNSAVVAGAISTEGAESILSACERDIDSSLFFIPYQVGLPEDRGGFPFDEDMDVPFFEIGAGSFSLTVAEPTTSLSAPDLVARFDRQRGAWDAVAAEGRLYGLGAQDVPLLRR